MERHTDPIALLHPHGDGTWWAAVPDGEAAEAWPADVRRQLAERPRPLWILAPPTADARARAAMTAAGLRHLRDLIEMARPPRKAGPREWPTGWRPRQGPPDRGWADALRVIQRDGLDWPELTACADVEGRLRTLLEDREARPEGWRLLDDGDGPAGAVFVDDAGDEEAVITFLGVAPRHRGLGLATTLFEAATARLPSRRTTCFVDGGNHPMLRWTARHGFVEVSRAELWFRSG